jgi:hypothetical protein
MHIPLTDDDGLFWGPEEAAFHACFVQGGFSTPEREAARMLLDGGTAEDRAWAWMADPDRNLTLAGLEWDPGMLEHYLARKEQETGQCAGSGRLWETTDPFRCPACHATAPELAVRLAAELSPCEVPAHETAPA